MKRNIPPGYSLLTARVLGRDITIAMIPDEVMKGVRSIVRGLKSGPVVRVKLTNGKVIAGALRGRIDGGYLVDVGGQTVKIKKPVPKTRITVEVPKRADSDVHR